MFAKKHIRLLLSFLLCAAMLTGCYPDGTVRNDVYGNADMSEIEEIVDGIENLELDLKLPATPSEDIYLLQVEYRRWDNDKLQEMFLEGKTVTESYEYESDYFSEEFRYVYMTDDEYLLIFESGRLSNWSTSEKDKMKRWVESWFNSSYNLDVLFTDENVSSFSRADAQKAVDGMFDKLGITNPAEPYVYAITVEGINALFPLLGYEDTASEDDEVYVFEYPLECEGIPVVMFPVFMPGKTAGEYDYFIGAHISTVVDREGRIEFSGNGIISAEYEKGEKAEINFSAADALKLIISEYSGGYLRETVTFYDCRLVYVPVKKEGEYSYTLSPMWQIDYYTDFDGILHVEHEYVNAVTGNKLTWGY